MSPVSLSEALTREHHDIDTGIETFIADLDSGSVQSQPLLTAFKALRRHIYLEEEFLFPPIRDAGLMMPVMVMLREHGVLWQLMDTLTELLDGHDSANIDERLVPTCRDLLSQLDQHNSKEEPIIYPHAATDLTEKAAAELAEFMRSGDTPSGWVCEAAR